MTCFDTYWDQISIGGFTDRDQVDQSQVDSVINVSQRKFPEEDLWHPLSDVPHSNTQQEFASAVTAVVTELSTGNTIFVHCAHGQSRSVAVVITALAELCNASYDNTKEFVETAYTGKVLCTQSLVHKAQTYLQYANRTE